MASPGSTQPDFGSRGTHIMYLTQLQPRRRAVARRRASAAAGQLGATPVSNRSRCRGNLRVTGHGRVLLPRREGPGTRRRGRAVVPGRIRGRAAELRAQRGGGVRWTAVQCLPGRPARRERRASALQGERAGQGGEARRWRRVWRAHRARAEIHGEDDDGLGFAGNWSGDRV